MKLRSVFILVGICVIFNSCKSQSNAVEVPHKFNGISFVGNPKPVGEEAFSKVVDLHANAITLMPFAYGRTSEASLTFENLDWQWWGESFIGVESCIQQAQTKGLDVIIKPQLWFDHGSFTGHHCYQIEADWESFEADYSKFILMYATLSEKYQLPVFCIGTELCAFVEQRPAYWRQLISKIRSIYSGKLIYASNWDSYVRVPFWDALDYVGIDAYFPLSNDKTPSVKDLKLAWTPICDQLELFSTQHQIPIVFMEWGYRSTDYAAKTPWETSRTEIVNLEAQSNAIQAVFETVWKAPWFAGGFIWKWFPDGSRGGTTDTRFTPQGKPAEGIIASYFKQFE